MLLLNNSFSLLGNTQTFIAAIATLCVLCFFRNESNFIELLIKHFNEKFLLSLQDRIAQLAKKHREKFSFLGDWYVYHKSADEEDKQRLLEIQLKVDMVQYKLYTDSERNSWIKTKFEETKKPLEQKQSQGIMAYFTFILCVLVLSFDIFVPNMFFAGWLLFFFNYILCIVVFSTWIECIDVKLFAGFNQILDKKWKKIISIGIILILFIVFLWTNSYFILLISIIISTILYYNRIISKTQKNDYNFVTITKDIVVFTTISILLSIFLLLSKEYGFIYNNIPPRFQTLIDIYNSNVLIIPSYITILGAVFAILCVLNAILIPVFLTYVKGQLSLKDIKKEYEGKLKEVETLEKEYKALKEEINNKIAQKK